MTTSEQVKDQLNELTNIMNNCMSMELRVENSQIEKTIKIMDGYGFKKKVSWASMERADHTVIDFWNKELIK